MKSVFFKIETETATFFEKVTSSEKTGEGVAKLCFKILYIYPDFPYFYHPYKAGDTTYRHDGVTFILSV